MSVEVIAPAKLTVSLRITGRRDDGYHLIDAEMVALDLHDTLAIDLAPAGSVGTSAVIIEGRRDRVTLGADNLVARALAAAGLVADVTLTKRIPAGAGLGGGSADAAAILRFAGVDDLDVAASLGADVPFCLVGGRARVRGIGEVIEPLPFEPRVLTLVTPEFGCSTPDVYAMWDEMGGPRGDNGNDLEPAAVTVEPRLLAVRDRLADEAALRPRLAGSGSTWFVEGAHDVTGGVVVRTVESRV
jgi:4-diphosphocytidyl-2-C-methyl-D-erythritol kinase